MEPVPPAVPRATVSQASADAPVRLEVVRRLHATEVDAVAMLVEQATEVDGARPLDEHVMLHLRYGGDIDVRHVMAWAPGADGPVLVGYGHLDVTDRVEGSAAELAVHPAYRRHGIGRHLVATLIDQTPDGRLRLWSHGENAAAGALAAAMGFRRLRVLWQLRRSLFAPLPRPELPQDVRLRPFRPGHDDERWLEVNRRAFVDLPDQGGWTLDDLHRRMREPWFDPEGFLLAVPADDDDRILGFHWTKVHGGAVDTAIAPSDERPEDPSERHHRDAAHEHEHRHDHGHGHPGGAPTHGHEPIGEVYVVGVDPSAQGLGLGRALTLAGLAHLRSAGLADAMLYVDARNESAIALYRSLGFAHWDTDVQYLRRPAGDTPAHSSASHG